MIPWYIYTLEFYSALKEMEFKDLKVKKIKEYKNHIE